MFVQSGHPSVMRAFITGVGDINDATVAPARILSEGRKILGFVSSAWGRSREYVDLLDALSAAEIGSHL